MTTGKRIIELRESMNLNQTELAQKIEINRSVLNRIEQGTRPIRDDELKKIASFFHVTTDYLLENEVKEGYYLDEETARIANEMKERPEMRVLFDASRKLSPEKMNEAKQFIDFLYKQQHKEDNP